MKKLLLIDANSLIHRSFHALPELINKNGIPTGALYGLVNMLMKILKNESPDYVAAAFDRPEPTFRKELSKEYKAHRPKAPDSLISQIKKAHDIFSAFGIKWFETPGYEADDIIGTLVKKNSKNVHIVILTGDLDSLQLVCKNKVVTITPKKGISDTFLYNEDAVIARFEIPPSKIVDYKALVGDKSDNISGVPGIGDKGAAKLLKKYKDIEDIIKNGDKEDPLVLRVKKYKNEAQLSKKLAKIHQSVPIEEASLSDLLWGGISESRISPVIEGLGFISILRRLGWEVEPQKVIKTPQLFSNEEKKEIFTKPEDVEKKEKILNNETVKKIGYDWKFIYKKLELGGKKLNIDKSFFDISIAAWLISSDEKDYSLPAIFKREYGIDYSEKKQKEAMENLYISLSKKLNTGRLRNIFENIEMPLIPSLGDMEIFGIRVNREKLKKLRKNISDEIKTTTKVIYKFAGEEFNINSPKQLSKILFEKMQLASGKKKKTKTGILSTNEDVLNSLKNSSEIIPQLLSYRENSKILGTYVEPFLLASDNDSIIRTTFIQTGTSTGRLASEKPNLQNLPQESKWSKLLRDVFEAEKNHNLVSFDYSQLELRILAHVSKDKNLMEAFQNGEDIHTKTAQKIFHNQNIDPQKRRVAKTLNFGVIYGMGARLFGKEAGISNEKAKIYINEYFREFDGVLRWHKEEKKRAKSMGYSENENGRKRWFSNSTNFNEIERAAINMPIQSVGADIMKYAMIKTRDYIEKNGIKLILTIHDELIFQIPDAILKKTSKELKEIMESCYKLCVPLIVDVKAGKTLGSMETIY